MLVPDGYYNARELDEEVFKPLGARLHLDTHTGLLQLTTKDKRIYRQNKQPTTDCCNRMCFNIDRFRSYNDLFQDV